jgi:hypothetical protein
VNFAKRRMTEAQRVGLQAKAEANKTASEVSQQLLEPVLHVARWAMLVALASFTLACVGIGLAIWALLK